MYIRISALLKYRSHVFGLIKKVIKKTVIARPDSRPIIIIMEASRSRRIIFLMGSIAMFFIAATDARVNRTLQMGVFLPYGGTWPIGAGISGAIPYAVERFRADPNFAFMRDQLGYDLNFTIRDTSCNEGIGVVAFANFVAAKSNPPIDVFIGI